MVLKETGETIIIKKFSDNCSYCNKLIIGNGELGASKNKEMHELYCPKNPSNKENVKK